jgi:mycoredoxin
VGPEWESVAIVVVIFIWNRRRGDRVPQPADVTVFSTTWCGHCVRLKRQLTDSGIRYAEVDIEEQEHFGDQIAAKTGGFRTVPAVRIGERLLVNPSITQVKEALAA